MEHIKQHSQCFLYHTPSGKMIEALSFDQLRQISEVIRTERSEDSYLVWSTNLATWMPLESQIEGLLNPGPENNLYIPELPEQVSESPIHHFSEAQMERLKEKRDYDRIEKAVPITLEIDGHMYRTETVDVSVNGMSLKRTYTLDNPGAVGYAYYQDENFSLKFKVQPVIKTAADFNSVKLIACTDFSQWISVIEAEENPIL